ncbi:hypothetical protein NP493_830g00004 [Ridgeia piscesae]|uniref:Uncharacterized protein n=1 Tax=Ridgeia piscesae TaxID=27915 RepID=A0AAD9KMH8_RIDPI|nr:hypothetical protein NP493_830g00004 [Ridgeia piscesae]
MQIADMKIIVTAVITCMVIALTASEISQPENDATSETADTPTYQACISRCLEEEDKCRAECGIWFCYPKCTLYRYACFSVCEDGHAV